VSELEGGIGPDLHLQPLLLGLAAHQQQAATRCDSLLNQRLHLGQLRLGKCTHDLRDLSIEVDWLALRDSLDLKWDCRGQGFLQVFNDFRGVWFSGLRRLPLKF